MVASSPKLTVVLSKDWDVPFRLTDDAQHAEGRFVGRKKEVDLLANEILRKKCGAILVSGYRGVGKTSLVYKAFAQAKDKDDSLVAVIMNAAQLEAEADSNANNKPSGNPNQIDPRHVIVNLIRRLYSIMHEKEPRNERLTNLYKRAVASSVKISESAEETRADIEQRLRERELKLNIQDLHAEILIFAISWGIAFVLGHFLRGTLPSPVVDLFSGVLFGPVPLLASASYRRYYQKEEKTERRQRAETLYEFDGSIGNLEFEFEQLHSEWANKHKLVYVIDELDKLDLPRVVEVLKFFKNLFTSSDAQFIFLGNDIMYRHGLQAPNQEEAKKSGYRTKEYTYFTSRYFLSRPQFDDIEKYLDGVFENVPKSFDLKDFKRLLCFESRNDFFDLRERLRDRISTFGEDHKPQITLGELDLDETLKARLHSALSLIFDQKYSSPKHSEWETNELILRALFDDAEKLRQFPAGQSFSDPDLPDPNSMAIRDFHVLLQRLGFLNVSGETEKAASNRKYQVRTYTLTGTLPQSIPGHLEEKTEFEQEFIAAFDDLLEYILAINNLHRFTTGGKELPDPDIKAMRGEFTYLQNSLQHNLTPLFDKNFPTYEKLESPGPIPPFRRDQIQALTSEVNNARHGLLTMLPHFFVHSLKQQSGLGVQAQNLNQNGNLFSGSASTIRSVFSPTNPLVLYKPDFTRQLMVVYEKHSEVENAKRTIKENSETHRIVLFSSTPVSGPGIMHIATTDRTTIYQGFHSAIVASQKFFLN